mmetsp:Transcript_92216/g.246557  ORF Transcript_92216/g.246557 Transcript_92216/m.246557 type:complete len:418 (+) Transcript_92216:75-1328(+)
MACNDLGQLRGRHERTRLLGRLLLGRRLVDGCHRIHERVVAAVVHHSRASGLEKTNAAGSSKCKCGIHLQEAGAGLDELHRIIGCHDTVAGNDTDLCALERLAQGTDGIEAGLLARGPRQPPPVAVRVSDSAAHCNSSYLARAGRRTAIVQDLCGSIARNTHEELRGLFTSHDIRHTCQRVYAWRELGGAGLRVGQAHVAHIWGQHGECLDQVTDGLGVTAESQADTDHTLRAERISLVQLAEIFGHDSSARIGPPGAACSSLNRFHSAPLALRLRRHGAHFHQSKTSLEQGYGRPPVDVVPWGQPKGRIGLQPAHHHPHVRVLALEITAQQIVSAEPQHAVALGLRPLGAQNEVPQLLAEAVHVVEGRQHVHDAPRCNETEARVVDAVLARLPALGESVARDWAQLSATLHRLHLG